MTENVAFAFGENIIGWEYAVSGCGVMACFFLSLWLYFRRNKKILPMVLFQIVTVIFSLLLCRVIYWYCHMELYTEIFELWTDEDMGHFFMFGIPAAAYFAALCMQMSGVIEDRRDLLDAMSPGLAFAMALFRFAGMFSGACYGKYNISNKIFMRLPFGYSPDGRSWKIAAFCISFMWLLAVCAILLVMARSKKHRAEGAIFRMFLILFSLSEVFIDSLRYDASHFFFPGKLLADLNKGTGFMGLSQLISAFVLIFIMAGCTCRIQKKEKKDNRKKSRIVITAWVLFITGTAVAGVCEYLVQRNSSRFVLLYAAMLAGIIFMGIACNLLYNTEVYKVK
ncbi:MAG: prolipoprotein diacylglyceryl transferase [Lachnospiraceae bacterium]|nr:prolipoprotein diacylglyceryl transferase [Lachnospiraceae bacterium]